MLYLIEVTYVGPQDQPKHLRQRIRIQDRPGTKNMSGEPCKRGWLGTTNDWNHEAIGAMDEDAARKALCGLGIQIPDDSPVMLGDYSYGYGDDSEWYNKQFRY